MNRLIENLNVIQNEKNNKIIPENIRSGVTIFDVTGTLEEGVGGTGTVLDVTDNSNISIEDNILVISDDFTTNYTQVEYIESSGTQYIDTGVKPTHNTSVKSNLVVTQATSGQTYPKLYGCTTSANLTFFLQADCDELRFTSTSYQNAEGYRARSNMYFSYGTKYEIVQSRNTLLIDKVFQTSVSLVSYNLDLNMFIFVTNKNGTPNEQYACMRLYDMKIYENEDLVRDFVPCYRKSDNAIGLYDKVNSQFYTNAGSGTFSKGDDV